MKRKRHQLSHDEPLCGGDLRLCGLFEDTPVAKHEIDANGVVVRVNQSECELLGYSPDEIIGKPVWALLRPKEQQESRDSVRRKFSGEQPLVPFEREYVRSDQTSVFVRIHESYIWNVHGAIVGLRSALLDITERKRDEELLRRQAIELQRSNAELEQFAYVVSHDLQEPLRMVASYTQLLARRYKGKLDSDADEFIAFAVDGAERMQRLIGDLLAYSRVGSREIEFRPVDSGAVVEEVLENLRLSISESGAVVSLDGLPAIQADPLQLGQLFQNLIGNALKFRGSRTPCLAVTAVEGEAEWQFCVQDNGIGIEPAHYERVFEVFRRLHTAKKYPGTGIGLAICKKIVERHGGRIWIDSTPGKGTRFFFTLAKTPGGVR